MEAPYQCVAERIRKGGDLAAVERVQVIALEEVRHLPGHKLGV